jgi:hypothetical protein
MNALDAHPLHQRRAMPAARATFAMKAGMWFRRGRLVIVSPMRHADWALSGGDPTYPNVQISRASSDPSWAMSPPKLCHALGIHLITLTADSYTGNYSVALQQCCSTWSILSLFEYDPLKPLRDKGSIVACSGKRHPAATAVAPTLNTAVAPDV